MPEKKTMQRAKQAKRERKSESTQAGAFVREETEHLRAGKRGARSAKEAIAIGLSKARRAGVKVRAPQKGAASEATRSKAKRDLAKGSRAKKKTTARRPSAARSRAAKGAPEREGRGAVTSRAPSRQARAAAAGRRRKRAASARRTKASAERST